MSGISPLVRKMLLGAAVTGTAALLGWFWITRPHLPPAERGRRLAARSGCFACHGPGGTRGTANPGRSERSVPTFESDLMMFADSEEAIREWIRNGVSDARARSKTWQANRDRGTLVMPAFGDQLDEREINDLTAFVSATHGLDGPEDALAGRGLERAEQLGCFGCHGPGGRFARPNPGSFKGYVPSWDGADFPELVRDRHEFDEWIERGISDRFERNTLARFFLERAVLEMPAYGEKLNAGDADALWAYVTWLRSGE